MTKNKWTNFKCVYVQSKAKKAERRVNKSDKMQCDLHMYTAKICTMNYYIDEQGQRHPKHLRTTQLRNAKEMNASHAENHGAHCLLLVSFQENLWRCWTRLPFFLSHTVRLSHLLVFIAYANTRIYRCYKCIIENDAIEPIYKLKFVVFVVIVGGEEIFGAEIRFCLRCSMLVFSPRFILLFIPGKILAANMLASEDIRFTRYLHWKDRERNSGENQYFLIENMFRSRTHIICIESILSRKRLAAREKNCLRLCVYKPFLLWFHSTISEVFFLSFSSCNILFHFTFHTCQTHCRVPTSI